jgi:hypothetical protein
VSAAALLEALRDDGLTVKELAGWKTRGGTWKHGKPIGLMQHHTAAPVPFPVSKLSGTLIKCNINTKPDGTVWLVSYGACNYSSGSGLSVVLNEVLAGTSPKKNAKDRGFAAGDDDTNGNPLFWNFENDHLGDGSPMPAVQSDAIVRASRISLEHLGLSGAERMISHAEWTARKQDPFWNGDRRVIEQIRAATEGDDEMTPEQEKALNTLVVLLNSRSTDTPPWGAPSWAKYSEEAWPGPVTSDPGPLNPVTHIQLAKVYTVLKTAIGKIAADGTDMDAIIAEIIDRLED